MKQIIILIAAYISLITEVNSSAQFRPIYNRVDSTYYMLDIKGDTVYGYKGKKMFQFNGDNLILMKANKGYLMVDDNHTVWSLDSISYNSLRDRPNIPTVTAKQDYGDTSTYDATRNWVNNALQAYLLSSNFTWNNLSGKPTFATVATTGQYSDLLGKPTLFSGAYSDLAGKPDLSVYATTSALTSGLAGKYNTPSGTTSQYIRGDGSLATFPSTTGVTSIGFNSSDFNITGTNPVTTTGNVTMNLFNSGVTAGSYTRVFVNAKGITTGGYNPQFNNGPVRSLNSSYQISTLYNARVSYTLSVATAVSLLNLNSSGVVFLEISSDNVNWTTISRAGITRALSVAISLGLNDTQVLNVQGEVPVNYYARLRSVVSGGATVTFLSGQEVNY